MSKRPASKDPMGSVSKLLKTIDNNGRGDESEDIFLESFIPQATSRRLEDSVNVEDDDLYRPSATGAISHGLKDFRKEMELKIDHENRSLWVTPGLHSVNNTKKKNLVYF